jgi:hypothetical protein
VRVEKFDGSKEKRILQAMITNTMVLGRVSSRWGEKGLFSSDWANLVGGWCVDYYRKHETHPGSHVEDIFQDWANRSKNTRLIESVDNFLADISDEYDRGDEINPNHVIDLAGVYFNRVRIREMVDRVQECLDLDNVSDAESEITTFSKVQLGSGSGTDLFLDEQAVRSVFDQEISENLIEYPGGLRRFFGDTLSRDSFIVFLGPEKSGKSFWLMDIAYRAFTQRKRVAYFDVGDMSENQVAERFLIRSAQRPLTSREWPCKVRIPTKISRPRNKESTPEIEYRLVEFDTRLDFSTAWQSCKDTMQNQVKSKNSYLKVACHPNSSATIHTIRSEIQSWELDGWVPDVIVIDYSDLLAPINPRLDKRDQINETWKLMRRLSQEYHCLLVTATQANALAYGKKILDMSNFSDDKRKNAHPTGLIAINTSPEENKRQIFRLNWIARRRGRYDPMKCVYIGHCLDLSNPAVVSDF